MKQYVLRWYLGTLVGTVLFWGVWWGLSGEVPQDKIIGTRIVLSRWWDLLFLPFTAAASAWITYTRRERHNKGEYEIHSIVHSGLRFLFWGGYLMRGGALNGILSTIGVPAGIAINFLLLLIAAGLWNELQERRLPLVRNRIIEFFSSQDETQEPAG